VLEVVDTALTHFPKCMPLLMTKANCLADMGMREKVKPNPDITFLETSYNEFKQTEEMINSLGHKDMPIELYESWIKTVENEKMKRNIKE